MPRFARPRSWLVLLSLLALAAQMLLPASHLLNASRGSQDWTSRIVCGSSPALAAQLRAALPPELLRQLEQHQDTAKAECGAQCIHHAQLAALPPPVLPDWSALRHEQARGVPASAAVDASLLAPRARGPPLYLPKQALA